MRKTYERLHTNVSALADALDEPLPKLTTEEEEAAASGSGGISLWEGSGKELVVDESALGMFGDEEGRIITPAIEALREEGYTVTGPVPGDALFTPLVRPTFDVALCMYHDQALIPIKALEFDQGVNVTLGLPIIRTSPDHGTAFDIAGKGHADASAMIAAIRMAGSCATSRANG